MGCDSMITTGFGDFDVGHLKGRKMWAYDNQIVASAGNTSHAARLRYRIETRDQNATYNHKMDYPYEVIESAAADLEASGVAADQIDLNAILAYVHNDSPECAIIYQRGQIVLLDDVGFLFSIGSGMLSADPFLRFVSKTFCEGDRPPTAQLAVFLVTWVIQYAIDTNPGGVDGPIRVSTLKKNGDNWEARDLEDNEMQLNLEALESATEALRNWRDKLIDDAEPGADAGMPLPPAQG